MGVCSKIMMVVLFSLLVSVPVALSLSPQPEELTIVSTPPPSKQDEIRGTVPNQPTLKCAGANCKAYPKVYCDPTKGDGACERDSLPPIKLDCKQYKYCAKCIGDLNCGWCATSQKCTEGRVTGPKAGNCTDWDYAFCSGEPCQAYGNCGACSQDPMCGWCGGNSSKCMEGQRKPIIDNCPSNHWQYERCSRNGKIEEKKVPNPNDPAQAAKKALAEALAEPTLEEDVDL